MTLKQLKVSYFIIKLKRTHKKFIESSSEKSHHRKSHESSERKEKSSSNSKHKSSSSSSATAADKAHRHKSNHHTSTSSLSSHNDKEKEKSTTSSSKKRRSSPEPELQSKEKETKKLKTESVVVEKTKDKDPKSHKSSSSSSNGHDKHHSSSSSNKRDSKSKKRDRKPSKEFDVSQGIGFAEALASFDMPTSSKHQKKEQLADKIIPVKSSSSKSSSSSSKHHKSSSSLKSEPRSSTSSTELLRPPASLTSPPKILTQKPKLEILNDIMSDVLPSNVSIPEYRPMPLNSAIKDYINTNVYGSNSASSRHAKPMNESEILAESFSSKSNRMRVYSGNAKARSQIPKLFDLCIRALQENIDFLECTGGVPFEILKPVLEKAKPEQLATIEYYNPYLLEESDILWQPHCQRKWKSKRPQEMETWREMYDRCSREEEEKLSRLTQSIKQNQEMQSSGVQKTKMAFVDSMVKPPRGMIRKQEQFGTNRKLVASPAARTQGLKNIAPNLTTPGDVRLRVAAGLRDDAQHGKLFFRIYCSDFCL